MKRRLTSIMPTMKRLFPHATLQRDCAGSHWSLMPMSEGVSDRVKIIPPVPYAELLTWTASADIGLVVYSPSYGPTITLNIQMCLPNKLFEYLMAGLPVLASSLDAVADIIRTYDVGCIVPSLESEEIARAISAMLTDRDALARMRSNALVATQRDLCWESESQRLIEFYRDILNAHMETPQQDADSPRFRS